MTCRRLLSLPSLALGAALTIACALTPGVDIPSGSDGMPGVDGSVASGGGTAPGSGGASSGGTTSSGAASSGGTESSSGGSGGSGGATGGNGGSGGATGGNGGTNGGQSAGCGAPTPIESGTVTMDVAGTERKYVLDVPTDYDTNTPYKLVFVWHPLGGSAQQVVNGGYDGMKSRSAGSAILVAPDGQLGSAAGIDGQGWYNQGGNDMAFLGQMLDHFREGLCIDTARIFSTGFSFGGMMSYAVGFEYGDVFRAIAPMSGNLFATPHDDLTTAPLAIMALHGDMDDFVATSGGFDALETYAARNGCGTETTPTTPSPCVEYQGCEVPTIWCEFSGGHAPWSGAPDAIWEFFSQF